MMGLQEVLIGACALAATVIVLRPNRTRRREAERSCRRALERYGRMERGELERRDSVADKKMTPAERD